MKKIVDNVYQNLLRVKKKESILIVCDKSTTKIAEGFFEHGYEYGSKTLSIQVPPMKHHGQEPSKELFTLMKQFDILLLITEKSLSHTTARKKLSKLGKRILTMPGIKMETLKRCVDIDYKELDKLHRKLAKRMEKAGVVRITTALGTDLSFKIYNKKVIWDVSMHRKGDFHNLPEGEVFVSPKEGTGNGVYYVDGSQAGVGMTKKPIKITVKKGMVTKIEGDAKAKKLNSLLKAVKRKEAFNLAELGIGTNPKAKIIGNVLEDEKVKGTCHIAIGNNYSFGGKVNVPIHLDGIIRKPTIYFDDKMIMKNGKFLI